MVVKIVDGGRCFGHDHWYMFYCRNCGKTIDMNIKESDRMVCVACGETIEYNKKGEDNE